MTTRRLYSVLAGREVDYPVLEPSKAPSGVEDAGKALAESERKLAEALTLLDRQQSAVREAEARATTEREGRIAAESSLAEARARIVELDARKMPEPQVIVKTVAIPGKQPDPVVVPFDDSKIMKALAGLVPAKQNVPLVFNIERDPMGRIFRIHAERKA